MTPKSCIGTLRKQEVVFVKKYARLNSLVAIVISLVLVIGVFIPTMQVNAKGPTYTAMQDVYYTKANCTVYAEPTYTSLVLTTIGANIPVQVIGMYSNGWYRINIGVICYVKMDSLTTAGDVGVANTADPAIVEAQATAKELGYKFVYLTLNKEKKIKKDIYNSYIGQKVILYTKINDELAVSFKMLYNDKIKKDISLNVGKSEHISSLGERVVEFTINDPTELKGQIAIFQFRGGYDKAVTFKPIDLDSDEYVEMNTYYTEFSQFAYAPVTQVASIKIAEIEIPNSLSDSLRVKMARLRQGIKYMSDDVDGYMSTINGKLRKDTEYVDYDY